MDDDRREGIERLREYTNQYLRTSCPNDVGRDPDLWRILMGDLEDGMTQMRVMCASDAAARSVQQAQPAQSSSQSHPDEHAADDDEIDDDAPPSSNNVLNNSPNNSPDNSRNHSMDNSPNNSPRSSPRKTPKK